MGIMDKSVTQANPLIIARKKMNVSEMRLFLLGVQDITPHIREDINYDLELHETIIAPAELKALFSGNDGSVAHLKKKIEKAYDGKIIIPYINGGFELNHIYNTMKYEPEVGLVIKFDNRMKPYILDILDQYHTTYKVKDVFPLTSEYGWRIMELLQGKKGFLKQGHKEVYVELSMEELRFCLNVEDGLYKNRIDNFKKFVLDMPIAEINEKTEYKVWYDVIKTGRRVTGFKLWMKKKNQEEKEKQSEADDERREKELENAIRNSEAVRALCDAGVNPARAKLLVEKYGEERCLVNLGYAKKYKPADCKNFAGFVISCIENDSAKAMGLAFDMSEEAKKAEKQREKEEANERGKADFERNYDGYEVTGEFWKAKRAEHGGEVDQELKGENE